MCIRDRCEPAVEGFVDLIERGKWSADTGIIAVDKEGRIHDGIQRLEAMRRVMSYVADLKLWVTIRFGAEFEPLLSLIHIYRRTAF